MARRIFEKPEDTCSDCTHNIDKVCLIGIGVKVPGCSSRTEDAVYQMLHRDIPVMRNILLDFFQDGKCPICNREIDSSEAVLDHQHKKKVKGTGQIRGVLCRTCNVLLGKSENNCVRYKISQEQLPTILKNMAAYLEQEQYPYMHPSEKEAPKYLKKSSYNELVKAFNKGLLKKSPPPWPEDGKVKLTVPLKKMFNTLGIIPEFYK